jgi:hypothetical protein
MNLIFKNQLLVARWKSITAVVSISGPLHDVDEMVDYV